VLPTKWVGVFEEWEAVEAPETMFVFAEVCGNPIQNHSDPGLMEVIDEVSEVFWAAVARGWCEVAGDLIPPRRVKRVFGDRHKFDMGVPH
jgi:hypothetical protein